jgi:fructokinase
MSTPSPVPVGRPWIISSGFSTVDTLVEHGHVSAAPGGTAVNVARALRAQGWRSDVVGTVGTDPTGQFLRRELGISGVGVSNLVEDSRWITPVIVQERRGGDHHWRFTCPTCGAKFAKHRPTSPSRAAAIASLVGTPDVFFFDRSSLFTLALAEIWAAQGALIFFEPAGLGRPHLFDRAVAVAQVVKFSAERLASFESHLPAKGTLLVETLGAQGMRFRLPTGTVWHCNGSNPVQNMVDSAGAGDWATAGLLDGLFDAEGSLAGFSLRKVNHAIAEAQRLGALACEWQGAYPEGFVPVPGNDFESFACPRTVGATKTNSHPIIDVKKDAAGQTHTRINTRGDGTAGPSPK